MSFSNVKSQRNGHKTFVKRCFPIFLNIPWHHWSNLANVTSLLYVKFIDMTYCNILNELLQVIPNITTQVWLISCISKVFTRRLLRYTYNRGTPQIQLSHHNHFLETTVRRERLMMWKSCEEGDVFSTVLPLSLTSFQLPPPPSFWTAEKSEIHYWS